MRCLQGLLLRHCTQSGYNLNWFTHKACFRGRELRPSKQRDPVNRGFPVFNGASKCCEGWNKSALGLNYIGFTSNTMIMINTSYGRKWFKGDSQPSALVGRWLTMAVNISYRVSLWVPLFYFRSNLGSLSTLLPFLSDLVILNCSLFAYLLLHVDSISIDSISRDMHHQIKYIKLILSPRPPSTHCFDSVKKLKYGRKVWRSCHCLQKMNHKQQWLHLVKEFAILGIQNPVSTSEEEFLLSFLITTQLNK